MHIAGSMMKLGLGDRKSEAVFANSAQFQILCSEYTQTSIAIAVIAATATIVATSRR